MQIFADRLPKYAYIEGYYKEIDYFTLNIFAVKYELQTEKIKICQSNVDRKHVKFEPVLIKEIEPNSDNQLIIKRLHFSEITKNNKFINDMPNHLQRYFILVIEFHVHLTNQTDFVLYSAQSEKIIVRVSLKLIFIYDC
jgi:hypothetical protein